MKARILPATSWDVDELACFMRASDRDECAFNARETGRYGPGWSIRSDLVAALAAGNVWSMWWGDHLMGMGGCLVEPHFGTIWFLGTDLADRHPLAMTRACRRFLDLTLAHDATLVGNVIPKHMAARVAWLQHLGFDMLDGEAHPMLQGHLFFWKAAPSAPTTTPRLP